jgi:hypothetical protein
MSRNKGETSSVEKNLQKKKGCRWFSVNKKTKNLAFFQPKAKKEEKKLSDFIYLAHIQGKKSLFTPMLFAFERFVNKDKLHVYMHCKQKL